MRQLLFPACVCLVAWSGATDSQPRLTLEEFSFRLAAYAPRETTGIAHTDTASERPRYASLKTDDDVAADPVIVALPAPDQTPAPAADLAGASIEFPVPSGAVVNHGIPAGVPLPPIAKPVIARSTEEICDTLTKSAQINNLPAPFLIRLLFRESRFDPGVISSAGAQGIAQFMPDTATDMGVENPFDPAQAIPASARLLNSLLRQFGNLGLAAAAYNAGPKRIQDWLGSKGKGKLPDETQGYVKNITGHRVENWTTPAARHPGEKLPRRAPCQESAGLLAWNGPDAVPMPQRSPLRAATAEPHIAPTEKPVVVAAVDRSDMKYADRAEREAEAAQSALKSAGGKPTAIKPVAVKTVMIKVDAKAVKRTVKLSDNSAARPSSKPPARITIKITTKTTDKMTDKTTTKREKIAQR